MGRGQGLVAGQGLKLIGRAAEGQTEALGQPRRHRFAEAAGGIQPGAHRRAADGQLAHLGQAGADGFQG